MNRLTKNAAAALFALLAGTALAQDAPDAVVKSAVEVVTTAINADKSIQAGNRQRINALVDKNIVPHLSMQRMTQAAAGPNWSRATPAQQQALIAEFKRLLTNTYAGALTSYRPDTKIEYKPLRMVTGDTDAVVRSLVTTSDGTRAIPIDYYVERIDGAWKMVDFSVFGARMVETYKNQFTSAINAGGIDGLIKALADKSNAIESRGKV
jgi:phospholipid transport system substrate-binding protein